MKKLLSLLAFIFCLNAFLVLAQPPAGYYNGTAGLYGTALQLKLHNIIDDHTVVSYSSLPGYFQTTDKKSNGTVWDMYSDIPNGTPPYVYNFNADECGNYNGEGDCFNREHSWPKSWFNDLSPMYSDLFHLYPTDGYVNGKRSNYPYGEVGSTSWTSQNGSKLGDCNYPGYSDVVFEPIDTYKGDFARTYFYMSTRYYTEDAGWASNGMVNKSQLKPWALKMMMAWHTADPVSTKETNRNNAVYGIQNNRNPFIDHPEFVEQIWGENASTEDLAGGVEVNIFPNPCSDKVSISTSNEARIQSIHLYNPSGATLLSFASKNELEVVLDVSTLAKGLYLIEVELKNGFIHSKLIKK